MPPFGFGDETVKSNDQPSVLKNCLRSCLWTLALLAVAAALSVFGLVAFAVLEVSRHQVRSEAATPEADASEPCAPASTATAAAAIIGARSIAQQHARS